MMSDKSSTPFREINRWLDALPRVRFGTRGREVPAFLACGVAGYHLALIVVLGLGIATDRSILVVTALAAACAVSFFAWALLRRRVTGREELVLLEHVWFALLGATGVLLAMGANPLPYLDIVAVGVAVFLASGRVGCLMAGCCHGRPSSLGLRYGEEHARGGFPRHLAGVRLFPVQAVEGAGLWGIALVGVALVLAARAGAALAWFLCAYAVMRFGLESLRGDERPHWLGLSQARWMGLVEVTVALSMSWRRQAPPVRAVVVVGALLLIVIVVAAAWWRGLRADARATVDPAHVAELRALAATLVDAGAVEVRATTRGVTIAASRSQGGDHAHVSLALPPGEHDLMLLCEVAARAFPSMVVDRAMLSPLTLLHLAVPWPMTQMTGAVGLAKELEGVVLRRLEEAPRRASAPSPSGGAEYFQPLPIDSGSRPVD